MKILKKLTTKTVQGKKIEPFGPDDKLGTERAVMTVYGRADKFEEGQNTLPSGDVSDYIKFRGAFAAFPGNMGEGDQCRSGVLIMPEVAGNILKEMLGAEGVQSVNFGFIIGIQKTETPIGYEYYATPLIEEAADSDPLAAIAKQVTAALPAPQKAPPKGKEKAAAAASA